MKKKSYRIFTQEEILKVHQATLTILREIGVLIEDGDTRKLLKQKGCKETAKGYLSFDEKLIDEALNLVPSQLMLYDRDGNVMIDTDNLALQLCPGLNCMNVLDHKTGEHRPTLLGDIEKTACVCDKLPNFRLLNSLGTPTDVKPEEEALATVQAMASNSKKPVGFTGHDMAKVEGIWTYFADLLGSWDLLKSKPVAIDLIGPSSPLKLGKQECKRLRFAGRGHLPVACYSGLIPGATGPLTLAGALSQAMAEILAGLVIHQAEGPGAPFVSGAAILPMEMRTGSLALGSPEYSLAGMAAVEYLNHIGVPSWIGAGISDAHTIGTQAVAETTMNVLLAAMSGTSLLRNIGGLSSCKTGSLEMLILCDEIAQMANRIITGVAVDEDTLAIDVVNRAHESTSYLSDPHTLEHVRTEMWLPTYFQRMSLEAWQESSDKHVGVRLKEKLNWLLETKE